MRTATWAVFMTAGLLLLWSGSPGAVCAQWTQGSSAPTAEEMPADGWFYPPAGPAVTAGAWEDAPELDGFAVVSIPGIALRPRTGNVNWGVGGSGGCIYASDGNGSTVFNAPVYLPQGATVKWMRMFYYDSSLEENSQSWFTVYDTGGDVVDEYGAAYNSSDGAGIATTAEINHTIDYALYTYVVNWRPNAAGAGMQACGFRIYYQEPTLKAEKVEIGPH